MGTDGRRSFIRVSATPLNVSIGLNNLETRRTHGIGAKLKQSKYFRRKIETPRNRATEHPHRSQEVGSVGQTEAKLSGGIDLQICLTLFKEKRRQVVPVSVGCALLQICRNPNASLHHFRASLILCL